LQISENYQIIYEIVKCIVTLCYSNFAYIVNITFSPDIAPTTVFANFDAEILEVLKIGMY